MLAACVRSRSRWVWLVQPERRVVDDNACDARTAEQGHMIQLSGDWLNYYGHYAWPSRLAVSL